MEALSIIKDITVIAGFPLGLIAAFRATKESRLKLRHQQAAEARKALDDLFGSPKARAAMQMIDWSGRTYDDKGTAHVIAFEDLSDALRITNLVFTDKERYIRDCFEDFFDRIQLMDHYARIDYLHFDDLAVPISYYARVILENLAWFEAFLDTYGYPDAKAFLRRVSATGSSNVS
jgi:hypothetical protein